MRYTPTQKAFLATRQPCFVADLFTVTLLGGSVYYWSTFDQSVTVVGHTFVAFGKLMQRNSLSIRNTVEVPEMELTLLAGALDLINGNAIKQQILAGAFDGATVRMERLFMPTVGDVSLGTVALFSGRMSDCKVSAQSVIITVKGDNVLMNQYAPKNVYQLLCLHSFCDAGCTLSEAANTTSNTVGASPTTQLIPWGSVPGSPSIYGLGKITFLSGIAAGQVRTVRSADASGIVLIYPLDDAPAPGDNFKILKGCDKTEATGSGQDCTAYANTQHYRGFRFIPPPETGV